MWWPYLNGKLFPQLLNSLKTLTFKCVANVWVITWNQYLSSKYTEYSIHVTKHRASEKGTHCTVAENSWISPLPKVWEQNPQLDKWAKSQKNLKLDSFHSAPDQREKCQLFHPLSDLDCHWRKLMSAFEIYDAFPCTLNIDFVTCTQSRFENLITQQSCV